MSSNLYARYRPAKLSEVVGQEPAVKQLEKYAKTGKWPHAFLFAGPSGVGKTTLARIVAWDAGIKLESDLQEINGASQRGIDDARKWVNDARLSAWGGGKRAFLVDECHQLTPEAQDSLLTAVEEPLDHVIWLFCTTNPAKVKPTLRGRCAIINLSAVSERDLVALVADTAKDEKLSVSYEISQEIARAANGSARQALMILEQVAGLAEKDQLEVIGTVQADEVAGDLVKALLPFGKNPDWKEVSDILRGLDKDPEGVRQQTLALARGILLSEKQIPQVARDRAYLVIRRLWDPFHDRNTGSAQLAAVCFEICHPKK